jgi:hypothetical protein
MNGCRRQIALKPTDQGTQASSEQRWLTPAQYNLGNHLKTGHTLSVQNRPMGLAEDVIVLPCRSVHLQGAIRDVAVMACFQAFLMHVMVVVAPPGSRLAE